MTRIGQRRVGLRLTTAEDEIEINSPGSSAGNTQLEVDVAVTMSVSQQANTATVRVMNLSRSTRQSIAGRVHRELDVSAATVEADVDVSAVLNDPIVKVTTINRGDAYVEIDAGYETGAARIFEGSCQWARHRKEGPTWVTEMQVGDGLLTMAAGVAHKTFPPRALAIDVVRYLVRVMGLDASVLRTPLQFSDAVGRGVTTFPDGFTASGQASWMVSNILEPFGAEWFVDRGQFFLVKRGHALPEPAVTVDFFSGLLHQPEPLESGGVRIRSMFRSDIRIGRLVQVSDVDYDGLYRCDVVSHRMNNRRGEAMTEAILQPPRVS